MKPFRVGLTVIAMAALTGFAAPTDTLPPNTVTLSQMMRELDTNPGFTEAFLKQLQGGEQKSGATLLTPDLVDHLRKLIVGKDWAGLDRFPGWTMASITPTVGALSRIRGDNDSPKAKELLAKYLDVGPYALNSGGTLANFRQTSNLPGFAADDPAKRLGYGVTRPDGPGPLAATHPESQRLAYALNRLAANGLDGVTSAKVIWNDERTPSTPEELIAAIADTGQTVTVTDSRYFANFGHLHWNGQNVLMPFFVDTQILVPGTKRSLLVPVSHAEYEWHIRGPLMNADVSFYFGIDGKAEWRTMDELDQPWVMKRDAHTFTGADALEVTRLFGRMTRAYVRLHQAHPATPFGGYYAFGVCQDVAAAVELKMTGKTTLFPNTADDRLFTDKRDAEINDLIRRLPKDRDGKAPQVDRIFGSLPVEATDFELRKVTIPGLGADLIAVHKAWTDGTLKRTDLGWWQRFNVASFFIGIALAVIAFFRSRWWKRSA
jgi:hypothetical protein